MKIKGSDKKSKLLCFDLVVFEVNKHFNSRIFSFAICSKYDWNILCKWMDGGEEGYLKNTCFFRVSENLVSLLKSTVTDMS